MNQIMAVGKGVVIAVERKLEYDQFDRLSAAWRERFPDIPSFFIGEAQIIVRDNQPILFQFTGDVTPTMVAEFRRWWEEVNG